MMDASIVVVGLVSPYLHITVHYVIVCMRKHKKKTYLQEDITQYCPHDFLMTQKTAQEAQKRRKAQPSLSVDNGGCLVEFRTLGSHGSSDFQIWHSGECFF